MRVWTVHLPPEAERLARAGSVPPTGPAAAAPAPRPGPAARPALMLREGFAWGAFLFGPFWLLRHRLWWGAMAWLGLVLLLAVLAPGWAVLPSLLAGQFLLGAMAQDLRAAALARRGYALGAVVAARDEAEALRRLLAARPALALPLAAPLAAASA
ncbi:DUF2628 domain-containing protein [Siccirubricoccus phaeus]|uniref:DUF2628 domain-containing protein n=1 Tax=Siccirubricoccus phaeus TaxID=2595053 RepID=UPI0011F28A3E|nr:DUF2628 domain-containing protein [Siccirubricoccus phaeus]